MSDIGATSVAQGGQLSGMMQQLNATMESQYATMLQARMKQSLTNSKYTALLSAVKGIENFANKAFQEVSAGSQAFQRT